MTDETSPPDPPPLTDAAPNGEALAQALAGWERLMARVGSWVASAVPDDFEQRLRDVAGLEPGGVDPFGFDPAYAKYALAVAAFLHTKYFRTIVSGIERIPDKRVILVANHAGQLPFDGVVVAGALFLARTPPRIVRAMVERWSQTLPFVSTFFARCGQVVGVPENAVRLLEREEAVLVFPEGVRGLSKPIQERYQLTDFTSGFMRLALQTGAPIVPVGIVGAEEQYIGFGNARSLAKMLGLPVFPLVPQFLLPGGLLPLPTRYRVKFGDPLYFRGDSDDDASAIEEKVWVVRATVQSLVNQGLEERKSLFF